MKLTEKQMIEIIKAKTVGEQTKEIRNQIMVFAFGENFMKEKEGEEWSK